ncbi:hypothetical protein [Actinomyces culturomici]|uniref:hypothetical protein n=1 Tax=Actinomyces culturomici TaxID=1926276 RepID=UPI000E206CB6|nr:hypothetical protein [Actinomyces culturomici]
MERIKQYTAAVAAAVLALIFLIVGVLAITVLKPAQELASSAVPGNTIVMTRDGVLPLIAQDVVVTATSKSGQKVALGVGTPGDVVGWIGDDPYSEVVGLTSDRSVLKVEEHGGAGSQSGAQSASTAQSSDAAQSDGAQSGDSNPAAAALVDAVSSSDMWLQVATSDKTASLDLTKVPTGRSVLAVSAGGAGDLQLTLTWATQRVNTLAIVAFLFAAVAAIVAGVLALSRRQLLRHRAERAKRIAERAGADVTDTQTIDTRLIAEMVDAEAAKSTGETPAIDEDGAVALETTTEGTPSDDGAADPSEEAETSPEAMEDADDVDGAETTGDTISEENEDESLEGEDAADESAAADDAETSGADGAGTQEPRAQGRHGASTGSLDEDPPEKVPTDTGIIDLSAIRPGVALPSRRALREAREKGEEKLVVDGREFDTGLIPVVSAPESADADTAGAEDAPTAGRAATSAWTSLMAGWLKKDGKDQS